MREEDRINAWEGVKVDGRVGLPGRGYARAEVDVIAGVEEAMRTIRGSDKRKVIASTLDRS
jgi:hypothetical protein